MMKTSKCRPKEVFKFFFVVLRFFSETIFVRTSSGDFDEIMMMKCGFKFNCCSRDGSRMQSLMHDEGKILLSVEMLNKFSKCRPQRLSSMMRGKRCSFFRSVDFGEFSKSRVLKKNVDGSKVHVPDVLKQRSFSYRRIEA